MYSEKNALISLEDIHGASLKKDQVMSYLKKNYLSEYFPMAFMWKFLLYVVSIFFISYMAREIIKLSKVNILDLFL